MESIRILMLIPYLPSQTNDVTKIAKNILNALQKKCKIEIIWILQTPKQNFENKYPNICIKPIQNYSNACEIIEKEKPDVIVTELSFDYSAYPIILAGKYMRVPVVAYLPYGYDFSEVSFSYSKWQQFMSKISRFVSRLDNNDNENKFLGRGRFYLYKYFFLLNTLKAMKVSKKETMVNIIENMWLNSFGIMNKERDSRLMVDEICLGTDTWIKPLENKGFPRKILHITGSPILDEYNLDSIPTKIWNNKYPIKLLVVTIPMHTHGMWSEKQQKSVVKQIIMELNKFSNKIEFSLKIHPTSEKIEFYQDIIDELNLKIPIYQNEKINDVLNRFDLVISFGAISFSNIDILCSGIPLVILNLVDKSNVSDTIKYQVATECNSIDNLWNSIDIALRNSVSKDVLSKFLQVLSNPFDGHASDRFADVILSVVGKYDSQKIK